jgi:hypothetical protein
MFHPLNDNHDRKEVFMCHLILVSLCARFNPLQYSQPAKSQYAPYGVEKAFNASVNLEETLLNTVHPIHSVRVVQEKLTS